MAIAVSSSLSTRTTARSSKRSRPANLRFYDRSDSALNQEGRNDGNQSEVEETPEGRWTPQKEDDRATWQEGALPFRSGGGQARDAHQDVACAETCPQNAC